MDQTLLSRGLGRALHLPLASMHGRWAFYPLLATDGSFSSSPANIIKKKLQTGLPFYISRQGLLELWTAIEHPSDVNGSDQIE
jgi:hypothetical protein